MRKHLILIAPIFAFFLVLSGGCSSTRSQQTTLKTSTMLQGQYTVEDVNKRGIIDYSQLTLRVNGNQVSGSTGCNHFTGSIESQGDALHISQLAVTRKLCPEALMHQEQQYISSLETVNTLSINTPYILLQNSNNDNVQVKLLKTSHASSLQPKRQDASAGVTHLFQCEDIGMISMMFVGPEPIHSPQQQQARHSTEREAPLGQSIAMATWFFGTKVNKVFIESKTTPISA